MPGYLTGYCDDVEVMEAGEHRPGEVYTVDDLKDMVRNFRQGLKVLNPPLVIGHEESQPLVAGMAENTGDPAVGWVTSLRLARRAGRDGKTRPVLLAGLHGVHPEIAAPINARMYRTVSPEVYDEEDLPPGAVAQGCRGKMLRRLSVLGGTIPQIKNLRDLPPVRFAESAQHRIVPHARAFLMYDHRERSPDGKAWRIFSEVSAMDGEAANPLHDALMAADWTQEEIDQLTTSDPMAVIVAHEMRKATGAAPTDEGMAPEGIGLPQTPPAAGMAEWPEGVTRDSAIADLVAAGEDQMALEAMTDDELLALWMDKMGGGAMPEGPGAAPMSETKDPKKFAEQVTRMVRAGIRRELAQTRVELAAVRKVNAATLGADREARVKRYCEDWRQQGAFLPTVVDEIEKQLLAADVTPVKKFGEKTAHSEFERLLAHHRRCAEASIKAGGVRRYGERLKDSETGPHGGVDAEVDAFLKRRHPKRVGNN